MKAFILVGSAASGKSTWVKNYLISNSSLIDRTVIISNDSYRREFLKIKPEQNLWEVYIKFNKAVEKHCKSISKQQENFAIANKFDIIYDNLNLNIDSNLAKKSFLEDCGYEVVIVPFDVTLQQSITFNANRLNSLNSNTIFDIYQRYLKYKNIVNSSIKDFSKENAVLCDIDGTIAHMVDRGPFEWHKVSSDIVDPAIKSIIRNNMRDKIIFLSGRSSECSIDTAKWLLKNVFNSAEELNFDNLPFSLYMRHKGDNRPDILVKKDLYDFYIKDFYNVQYVLDDRPCVVDLWNDLGLKTLACSDQRIKF